MSETLKYFLTAFHGKEGEPSSKRYAAFACFMMMVEMTLHEQYTGVAMNMGSFGIYAGVVFGSLGMTLVEKKTL